MEPEKFTLIESLTFRLVSCGNLSPFKFEVASFKNQMVQSEDARNVDRNKVLPSKLDWFLSTIDVICEKIVAVI